MIYYIIKILLIFELPKWIPTGGSIVESFTLVVLPAIVWLYVETKDITKIANPLTGSFWLIIPSLIPVILFSILLRSRVDYWWLMGISFIFMVPGYFVMMFILRESDINL